ncbi:leucine--tRNA ligase [bacterium]|nr:leucine--tRNA ligase [bacterium]
MVHDRNAEKKERYQDIFRDITEKWQARWQAAQLYKTVVDDTRPKFYCLDFFPYPSGAGLSVGHLRNYVPSDVVSRVKKMQGYSVLHPMGWDAFGFPAENYAIQQGVHPAKTTRRNIDNYKRQMSLVELSYDWDKEISSVDPAYYRWTQWFFLLLYNRGLAYQAEGAQWWCPECKSVLANEQVENGRCWRHPDVIVTKKTLKQWFFKITEYSDALLDDLQLIDWPDHIKKMQENWIGKSYGCEALFRAANPETGKEYDFPIFTTRIDTVFGVTYMVIAPEHPLVGELTTEGQRQQVRHYVESSKSKSEIDRLSLEKEKTGVFTGSYAINPLTNEQIPIWIADYVLVGYGTGIVMAVPAHDTRDYAFARKYELPVRVVISSDGQVNELDQAYTEPGIMVNSGMFDGLSSPEAIGKITDWLAERHLGRRQVNYKIRDWLISRQRYWGAPVPIIHCERCGTVPVPEHELPVLLPDLDNFSPTGTGESPLGRCRDFVQTTCPSCGGPARRETDTMDGFACSSWYFLRFPDPSYTLGPFNPGLIKYWLPVDLYIGGAEHAVMHLLYARFWVKVMFDAGLVQFKEPFAKLRNQGMLLGEDGFKMSKSRGNVVTPDVVVDKYGPDSVRLYVLFLGSFEQDVAWDEKAISGIQRFLNRFWEIVLEFPGCPGSEQQDMTEHELFGTLNYELNYTIKKVTDDFEAFAFNTAIAQLMTLLNTMSQASTVPGFGNTPLWSHTLETMLVLLAPMAPFICEELWERTGRSARLGSVHKQKWPVHDAAALVRETVLYPVQVNGKIRDRITVPADISEEKLKELVLASERIQKHLDNGEIVKFIVVPRRLISIAVKMR